MGMLGKKIRKPFNKSDFMKKVEEKRLNWERELRRFIIGSIPPFDQVKKVIEDSLIQNPRI
jgi:hypothetical protein